MSNKWSTRALMAASVLCFAAAFLVSAAPTWHFYLDEMTDGAFLKAYWKESVASIVLTIMGVFLLLSAEER